MHFKTLRKIYRIYIHFLNESFTKLRFSTGKTWMWLGVAHFSLSGWSACLSFDILQIAVGWIATTCTTLATGVGRMAGWSAYQTDCWYLSTGFSRPTWVASGGRKFRKYSLCCRQMKYILQASVRLHHLDQTCETQNKLPSQSAIRLNILRLNM